MLLLATILLSSLPPQGGTPGVEWVVKDTLIPLLNDHHDKFYWNSAHPFGDPDQDGNTNILLSGNWDPEPSSGRFRKYYLSFRDPMDEDFAFSSSYLRHDGAHDWGLLKSPTELRLLLNSDTIAHGTAYTLHSLTTGAPLAQVFPPKNLGVGIPDPPFFGQFYPAGDVNGDGFDEFFWGDNINAGWAYFGLIDGATLQPIWTHAELSDGAFPSVTWEPSPMPDLTGDGIADFLVGSLTYTGPFQGDHSWFLLSGADGSIVWRENAPELITGGAIIGRDLNGDGSSDAVLWEQSKLRAISAKDGMDLWAMPWSILEATLPAGWIISNSALGERAYSSGLLASDPQTVVCPFMGVDTNSTAITMDFGIVSGADGTLLGTAHTPPDLAPWDPSILFGVGGFISYFPTPHGDYDRDGFMEYSIWTSDAAHTPAWALAGSIGGYSRRLVILGQRTLFTPDTHVVMSAGPVTFDLLCPTGPGKDFVVLLSTAFSEENGLSFGRWKTYLGTSTVLDLTASSRFLSGTLDSDGQGSTFAIIPPNPALIGQTLYSRGLILNPPGSAEPIWTITSLSTTELQ